MAYKVLFQADSEPYEGIIPLFGDRCETRMWTRPEPDTDFAATEAIYVYSHMWVDRALMARMPKLRVISNFGVGCDHIDLEGARQLGLPVGNTPGVLDTTTADQGITLMMAAARNLVVGEHFARGPDFTIYDPAILLGQMVTGATLGIVGLGRIGYQVAKRAVAFDMPILYHNRTRNDKAERDFGACRVSLDELLSASDFTMLCMPLNDETRGMIGARELALMKPTSVLINIARGGVLDHDALLETLTDRRIFAAAPRRHRAGAAPPRPPAAVSRQPGDRPPSRQRHEADPRCDVSHVGGQHVRRARGPRGPVPNRLRQGGRVPSVADLEIDGTRAGRPQPW